MFQLKGGERWEEGYREGMKKGERKKIGGEREWKRRKGKRREPATKTVRGRSGPLSDFCSIQ